MASKALDLTTICHALMTLADQKDIGARGWDPLNESQQLLLGWYDAHRDQIAKLGGLKALASTSPDELNKFLSDDGFDEVFDDTLDGIGVVSILDMLVEWIVECKATTVSSYDDFQSQYVTYPAFSVPSDGVRLYQADGFEHPLAQLRTKTGHNLWLMKTTEPESALDLAMLADAVLNAQRLVNPEWSGGVRVPMLDMDIKPDISWLCGMQVVDDDWFIAKAFQQFKLRMNEQGARVKVATSLFVTRGMSLDRPYVFNQPFMGFFTQPDHDGLPLAAFYADKDIWRTPKGSLEEL